MARPEGESGRADIEATNQTANNLGASLGIVFIHRVQPTPDASD